MNAKDDLLAPIKAFMHGAQRAAYDEAIAFLREEEANFAELSPADGEEQPGDQRENESDEHQDVHQSANRVTGDELPQLGAHRRTRVDLLDDRTAVRVYA